MIDNCSTCIHHSSTDFYEAPNRVRFYRCDVKSSYTEFVCTTYDHRCDLYRSEDAECCSNCKHHDGIRLKYKGDYLLCTKDNCNKKLLLTKQEYWCEGYEKK